MITQLLLVLLNCCVSKNIGQFIVISLNLIVSTIVANITAIKLYMVNVCGGSETMLLLRYALVIGCVYVTVLSIILFAVKQLSLKALNTL